MLAVNLILMTKYVKIENGSAPCFSGGDRHALKVRGYTLEVRGQAAGFR